MILTYDSTRIDKDLIKALSPACIKIKTQMQRLTHRKLQVDTTLDIFRIGMSKLYDNYEVAEVDILRHLTNSAGPIRLFFYIASHNICSLFHILQTLAHRGDVEIRILHSAVGSPLFSPDRLLSIGKNPELVIHALRYVDESLRELESIPTASLRHRTRELPFIWRLYGFSDKIYIMLYFANKDATKVSPVMVFDNRARSLYHSFIEWFDYEWKICAPKEVRLDDIVTPATPAGAALFLKWGTYHVFGIPGRDINQHSDYIRFYGLGGKRVSSAETPECAMREGSEESGFAVKSLRGCGYTDFFRADGTIERLSLHVNGEIRPRLIFEKKSHSGFGSMKTEDAPYYMVGYDAELHKRPVPAGELAALLFLEDKHLHLLSKRIDITLAEMVRAGAEVDEKKAIKVPMKKVLVPIGIASYIIRVIARRY